MSCCVCVCGPVVHECGPWLCAFSEATASSVWAVCLSYACVPAVYVLSFPALAPCARCCLVPPSTCHPPFALLSSPPLPVP